MNETYQAEKLAKYWTAFADRCLEKAHIKAIEDGRTITKDELSAKLSHLFLDRQSTDVAPEVNITTEPSATDEDNERTEY